MASSKREKELARQRAERQAARRAAAAQRKKQRTAVIASVAAVVLVVLAAVAVGVAVSTGDDLDEVASPAASPTAAAPTEPSAEPSEEPSEEPSAEPSAVPSVAPSPSPAASGVSCTYVPAGAASKPAPTPPTEDVEDELVLDVRIATNQGAIVFEMDTAQAPCTASSLRTLASVGYFDDTPCHRLTTRGISVLQCGDPSGTGRGGPGYVFANENLEGATYPRGTVAMANGGPDTNGSQFFLVYADSQLPPAYTPFGRITEGLDVLDRVAAAGSDESSGAGDGKPLLPVQIERLRVTARAA